MGNVRESKSGGIAAVIAEIQKKVDEIAKSIEELRSEVKDLKDSMDNLNKVIQDLVSEVRSIMPSRSVLADEIFKETLRKVIKDFLRDQAREI